MSQGMFWLRLKNSLRKNPKQTRKLSLHYNCIQGKKSSLLSWLFYEVVMRGKFSGLDNNTYVKVTQNRSFQPIQFIDKRDLNDIFGLRKNSLFFKIKRMKDLSILMYISKQSCLLKKNPEVFPYFYNHFYCLLGFHIPLAFLTMGDYYD